MAHGVCFLVHPDHSPWLICLSPFLWPGRSRDSTHFTCQTLPVKLCPRTPFYCSPNEKPMGAVRSEPGQDSAQPPAQPGLRWPLCTMRVFSAHLCPLRISIVTLCLNQGHSLLAGVCTILYQLPCGSHTGSGPLCLAVWNLLGRLSTREKLQTLPSMDL